LIGGLTSLFTAYLNGRLGTTRKQFIDYCVDMLMGTAATYVPGVPGREPEEVGQSVPSAPRD